jgi:hypothetical protein
MTDWDAKAAKVEEAMAVSQDRYRRAMEAQELQRQAEERANQAKDEVTRNKLLGLAEWAVKRYRAASIAPLSVYAVWDETVRGIRGLLREHPQERRRSRIAEVYPLSIITNTMEGGDYEGFYKTYEMWVVATDGRPFSIYMNRTDPSELTEIVLGSKEPVRDLGKISHALMFPSSRYSETEIEAELGRIHLYVTHRTIPGQRTMPL